jgi:hypothetical protein
MVASFDSKAGDHKGDGDEPLDYLRCPPKVHPLSREEELKAVSVLSNRALAWD